MQIQDFEIILVDDDVDVLEVSKLTVEELGYKCKDFTNPAEAVEYISNNKKTISLILSDLRMDNINGFEFKKLLNGESKEIPFVILTGYWTKEMSLEAMELGIDAFIEKPVTDKLLLEQIEKFAKVRAEQLIDEREMVEGFLEESSPMLDEIESLILELEEDPENSQTLSVYFRLLHTIKGTASCVGLTCLGDYTHKYEDFINELRNKKFDVNTHTTNVLLEGLDDLKKFFEHIQNSGHDKNFDISEKVNKYDPAHIAKQSQEIEQDTEQTDVKVTKEKTDSKSSKKDDDKMMVSMGLLNEFMEESGELTVIRNSILKTVKKIEMKYRGDNDIEMLNELLMSMYDVTSNVQGKITEMRKVPLKNTFRPFKRLIRDLSKQLGKQVEFNLEGEELAVDNIVAKLFNNTLIHLLRNSLDHGLEVSDDREKKGKDPVGKLDIAIKEVGDEIVLTITDDGKGINPTFIRQKALEKGLYTEDELSHMSEIEIINIIFASGFSTAEQVSDLSGRGVGMDMVRGSFEEMGGSCYVKSQVDKGSTFVLTVPVPKSVLIVNTLSVRVGANTFIFHMDEVAEVIRYEKDTSHSSMYYVDEKPLLCHNDEMIQLIHLKDVLKLDNINSEVTDEVVNIVVLRVGDTKFGILVDEIYEFEEVVSRKILEDIESQALYHGASQLGTGEIALILSAQGLADKINLEIEMKSKKLLDESELDNNVHEIKEYMLFKFNSQKYLSVDLDDVERLEKFDKSKLEHIGNNVAIRYLNRLLPIIEPSGFLRLDHGSLHDRLEQYPKDLIEVIVAKVGDEKVGILVHELDEIQQCDTPLNEDTVDLPGLQGSIWVKDQTICVLDLKFILETYKENKIALQFNEWNEQQAA